MTHNPQVAWFASPATLRRDDDRKWRCRSGGDEEVQEGAGVGGGDGAEAQGPARVELLTEARRDAALGEERLGGLPAQDGTTTTTPVYGEVAVGPRSAQTSSADGKGITGSDAYSETNGPSTQQTRSSWALTSPG